MVNKFRRIALTQLTQRRVYGQSIPLIALMIGILFGMVGLAVDVGNTYAEQRRAVTASNAAALAGMDRYLNGRARGVTNAQVMSAIEESLKDNRIVIGNENDQRQIKAWYLRPDGTAWAKRQGNDDPLPLNEMAGSNEVPADVGYIGVNIKGLVNTFFARVVGTQTLPVNATGYAGRCPTQSSILPIGIDQKVLNISSLGGGGTGEFNLAGVPPSEGGRLGLDPTEPIPGATWRRIYLSTSPGQGEATFLRWLNSPDRSGNPAGSIGALRESLTGEGNLPLGFEEAPWPQSAPDRPNPYPTKPNVLNMDGGDWVYGTGDPSFFSNSAISQLLQSRSVEVRGGIGQVVYLPIYLERVGSGNDSSVRVSSIQPFLIWRYNPVGSATATKPGPYIDLILARDLQRFTACSESPIQPLPTHSLRGNVSFYPVYPLNSQGRDPSQIVVVLDISGSMNLNFAGQGQQGGQVVQCEVSSNDALNANRRDCGNPAYAWSPQNERRIYVAKKSIERLISRLNWKDGPNYDATRPSDEMVITGFNDRSQIVPNNNWRTNPTTLKQDVTNLGKHNGDPYLTPDGGTNGAAGLARAAQLFQSRPEMKPYNGKQWKYKRVVVFITDGVSNHFYDPNAAELSGGKSGQNTYPTTSDCYTMNRPDDELVLSDALCQTTDKGGTYQRNGRTFERPVTAMVEVARPIKEEEKAQIFVLALSSVSDVGLKNGVASAGLFVQVPELIPVGNGTNLDAEMDKIATTITRDPCQVVEPGLLGTIRSGETEGSPFNYPTVGLATLSAKSGNIPPMESPITADSAGNLSYNFTNVPRGEYNLTAYLFFRHPDDKSAEPMRVYSQIEIASGTFREGISVTVPDKSSGDLTTVQNQDLKLGIANGPDGNPANVCRPPGS